MSDEADLLRAMIAKNVRLTARVEALEAMMVAIASSQQGLHAGKLAAAILELSRQVEQRLLEQLETLSPLEAARLDWPSRVPPIDPDRFR